MPKQLPSFSVQRDTREQNGWYFEPEEKESGKVQILGTVDKKIDAGDYCIEGYPELCCIERKHGTSELFSNLMNKSSRERFERELERMEGIKHKYLLIESNIHSDIMDLSIQQYRNGPCVKHIIDYLEKYSIEYSIQVRFVGDCGKDIAARILRKISRQYL